jgi:hypothetical protein
VGGLLALAGTVAGAIATIIRDAAQQRHETRKRRADKFEELVAVVYEFDRWLEDLRDREEFGREGIPVTASPIVKVKSISTVYFPQFSKLVLELEVAADQYRDWIYAARQRSTDNVAYPTEGFDHALWPYLEKREALLDALKKFARNEFQ